MICHLSLSQYLEADITPLRNDRATKSRYCSTDWLAGTCSLHCRAPFWGSSMLPRRTMRWLSCPERHSSNHLGRLSAENSITSRHLRHQIFPRRLACQWDAGEKSPSTGSSCSRTTIHQDDPACAIVPSYATHLESLWYVVLHTLRGGFSSTLMLATISHRSSWGVCQQDLWSLTAEWALDQLPRHLSLWEKLDNIPGATWHLWVMVQAD